LTSFFKIIGAALLVLAINVLASILYMVVYSYVINPGHPSQFYQEYAQVAAPYSSIIAGFPIMYFVCRWLSRRWKPDTALKDALSVWLVYTLIDVIVLLAAGTTSRVWLLATISHLTKLAAAYLGGIAGSRAART
jgi:hypothetical protein